MSDDFDDAEGDAPGEYDGRFQVKPSGAQNRKAAKASTKSRLAPFTGAALDAIQKLGEPPADPAALALWFHRGCGLVAHLALVGEIGPGQAGRLKLYLDASHKAAMQLVRALDKKKQQEIAERVGAVPETDDGLDAFPGAPALVGDA